MLMEYLPLLVILIVAVLVAFIVVGLGHGFGPKRPTQRKAQPYESGMKPYGNATRRISVRYYLVAVLFILFDVEVIFFLPWAVAFKQLGLFALVEMFIFVAIILVGFVYLWKKGAFEWE